jgi:hypothetical protein
MNGRCKSLLVTALGFLISLSSMAAGASDTLIIGDTVESTTGGFTFPDGTTQTTAATGGGSGISLSSPDDSITVGGTGTAPTVLINRTLLDALYAPASGSANYAPASGSPNYVAKVGDSMSGNLTVNGTVRATTIVTGDPATWGNPAGLFLATDSSDFGGVTIAQPAWSNGSVSLNFTVDEVNNIGGKVKFFRTGEWDQGDLTFWTAPAHNGYGDFTEERLRITSDGDVGIGTTSPTAKLDVAGTVKANSFSGNGAGLTNVTATAVTNGVYSTGSYTDPSWLTSLAGSKVTGDISGKAANVTGTVPVANGGTGSSTAAGALTSLGAVAKAGDTMTGGLAVTTGSSHGLHVTASGSGAVHGMFSYSTGLSRAGVFEINNGSNGGEAILAKTNGSGSAMYASTTGSGNAVAGWTSGTGKAGYFEIHNATSGNDALYATTNGTGYAGNFGGHVNVSGAVKAASFQGDGAALTGVSDSTKVAKAGDTMTGSLTVNGTVRATRLVTGDPAAWGNAAGLFLATSSSDSGGVTLVQPDWVNSKTVSLNFTVDEANNIGAKVKFFRTGNWDQGDLTFWTNPERMLGYGDYTQERMRIKSDGNVGIGTTTPTARLDVAGSAKVTGGLTVSSPSSHGLLVTAGSSGAVHGIYSYSTGLSRAGVFEISNPSNGGEAVLAKTNGSGSAVYGSTTGTGNAGAFTVSNAASSADALYVSTNGTGNAGNFAGNVTVSGNLTVSGAGAMPVYNASGTAQAAPHMVTGTVAVNPAANVSLSGSAAFSDAGSYTCTATINGVPPASLPVGVQYISGSSFNLYSNTAANVSYICVGI